MSTLHDVQVNEMEQTEEGKKRRKEKWEWENWESVFRLTVVLFSAVASFWMLFLRVESGMRLDQ